MIDERRQKRAQAARASRALAGLGPRLRLFGLLALLIPLFAGLQFLVYESVPRVEVRFVPADAPAAEQPPTERVVERIVFVPIESAGSAPMSEAGASLPQAPSRGIGAFGRPRLGGSDSSASASPPAGGASVEASPESPGDETVESEPESAVVPDTALTEHMGLVAVVTPATQSVIAAAPRTVPA